MGVRATNQAIRSASTLTPRVQELTPIATDIFIPNLSGIASHPEAVNTFVKKTGDTMTGTAKLKFYNDNAHIYALIPGYLVVAGADVTEIGTGGDITLGDGTNRVMEPIVDETVDLGSDSFRFKNIYMGGDLDIKTGNIIISTSTGTKIGTSTTQLIGFYGAAPVDRPATIADPTGGATIDAESRTAIIALIDRLQELGLIA